MIIGSTLNGRYKLLELIGGGGMASVYRSFDSILEREVAVKVLRQDLALEESSVRRFRREAQSAITLSHPNIVTICDVGESDGFYFIVMEYVKGSTLKQYIQRNAPVPLPKVLHIMEQLSSAIAHAHQRQIIHRDIKPQNVLIDAYGIVKIADFGIATLSSAATITHTNTMLGSVHYLSPEQARGGIITSQTDIYSLGILFYELLAGNPPFEGETPVSIALHHLQTPTPSIRGIYPNIPQSIENIITKATAKDVHYRYQTVMDMYKDIMGALSPENVDAAPYIIPSENEDQTKAIPVKAIVAQMAAGNVGVNQEQGNGLTGQQPIQKKPLPWYKHPKKRLAGILVMILIIVATVFAFNSNQQLMDVVIPNVENESYEDAIETLESKGLKIEKTIEQSSEDIEEGNIIKTRPRIGTTVKEGTKITLYKSTGIEKVEMDNYLDEYYDEIKEDLEQIFAEVKIYEVASEEDRGKILEQSPNPGEKVIPSKTSVSLVVSQGPEQITMLDFVGSTRVMVDKFVKDHRLNLVSTDEYSDTIEKGLIIRQKPSPDEKLKEGDTIQVVISKGTKEKPPEVVNVEVTIPFDPNSPNQQQEVQIYIDDLNRVISQPAETFYITQNTLKTITLTIPFGKTAEYKIQREKTVITHERVPYPNSN